MNRDLFIEKFNLSKERDLIPRILGLREAGFLQTETITQKIESYSREISVRIAERLLAEIPKTVTYYDYLSNHLIDMVFHTISFNNEELVFSDTVIASIPGIEFKKFGMSKQALIEEVNKTWKSEGIFPQIILAELTDWSNSEMDINVNFILKIKA